MRQAGMPIPASLPGLIRAMNQGMPQHHAPLPGMPGWVPPAPGARHCPCGYYGTLFVDRAVGCEGLFEWCPRCRSNLGYAPKPPDNPAKTLALMILAAAFGACCVLFTRT